MPQTRANFGFAALSRLRNSRAAAVRQTTGLHPAGQRRLPVLAGLPEHVARAFAIGVTAGHEKVIRQAIEIFEHFWGDTLPGLVLELGGQPFGAPANGPRQVQMGRGGAAARQDERAQRGKLRIEPIDLGLEPSHLFIGGGQPRPAGPLTLPRRAKVGADIEQIVLDPRQRGMERGIAGRVQPRDAYGGIGFIHRAIGGDPQIVFLTPPAGAERGRAVVAGARVDFVQNDHRALRSYFAISQTVNMIRTMAMNCSKTRNRINCCDRCGEPPRIILMRPSNNTTATAPIAIGTPIWDMKLAMQVYVAGLERERKADGVFLDCRAAASPESTITVPVSGFRAARGVYHRAAPLRAGPFARPRNDAGKDMR